MRQEKLPFTFLISVVAEVRMNSIRDTTSLTWQYDYTADECRALPLAKYVSNVAAIERT